MKAWKKSKLKRAIKALDKATNGCMSATCPFRDDDDSSVGTANLCRCKEQAEDISKSLAFDIKERC
jgi:hypothetical protein